MELPSRLVSSACTACITREQHSRITRKEPLGCSSNQRFGLGSVPGATVLESLERRCLLAAIAAPATPVHLETTQPAGQVILHLESGAETTSFALPGGALPGNPQAYKSQHVKDDGYQKSNGVLSKSGHDAFGHDSNVEDGADPPATLDFDRPLRRLRGGCRRRQFN